MYELVYRGLGEYDWSQSNNWISKSTYVPRISHKRWLVEKNDTVNVIVHCPHPRPSIFVITLVLVAIIIVIDLVVFVTILLGILNCSSTYQS